MNGLLEGLVAFVVIIAIGVIVVERQARRCAICQAGLPWLWPPGDCMICHYIWIRAQSVGAQAVWRDAWARAYHRQALRGADLRAVLDQAVSAVEQYAA